MDDIKVIKKEKNEITYEYNGCTVCVVREFEDSDKTVLEQLINMLVDIMEKEKGDSGG